MPLQISIPDDGEDSARATAFRLFSRAQLQCKMPLAFAIIVCGQSFAGPPLQMLLGDAAEGSHPRWAVVEALDVAKLLAAGLLERGLGFHLDFL
jgi:hypothetical protein